MKLPLTGGFIEYGVVQWGTTPPSGHPSTGGEFLGFGRFFSGNSLNSLSSNVAPVKPLPS
jgi:hypothetical protein